ncbi:hypothetical protein [Maribacter litoralis]|nr:hypothetical protein [Maribacter litoralis]
MRLTFTYIFFLLMTFGSFAQLKTDSIVKTDTSSVLVYRDIEEDLTKKYTGDEFNYTYKTGESQNLLARFLNWVGEGLFEVFGITLPPNVLQLLEYLIYILLGILAIYLIVKFLINENFSALFQTKAKTLNDINLTEEHIEGVDISKLLNDAVAKKDYRQAVRYQFLLTLQKLSKKDIIDWHFDKTNTDYLNEIEQPQLKLGFKKIAYLYDYIWYGEQAIDSNKYNLSVLDFDEINKLIQS